MRNTAQRRLVLDLVRNGNLHPTADQVFELARDRHPTIGRATVYRNLSRFKNQGLIQSLGTVNGIERFDANTEPHVHFVCNCCSAVMDLHQMDAPQRLCQEAAQHLGGQVDSYQLMFFGTCQACLAKNQSA